MTESPFYQRPVMHSIESTVLAVREAFTKLLDADVEFAYDQLATYYKALAAGKDAEEPLSNSERRQAVIDEILNTIEEREEMEFDLVFINNEEIKPNGNPIPSLPALYVAALKRLSKSVRFWRKEMGKTAYLNYISEFM